MPDHIPLPAKQYSVIYADPPWAYSQGGNTKSSRGIAKQHYPTMTTAEICAMPVREIVREGAACFMWATCPNITEAIKDVYKRQIQDDVHDLFGEFFHRSAEREVVLFRQRFKIHAVSYTHLSGLIPDNAAMIPSHSD